MNITVYLGSSFGNDPKLETAVRALGRWIGESGYGLVSVSYTHLTLPTIIAV